MDCIESDIVLHIRHLDYFVGNTGETVSRVCEVSALHRTDLSPAIGTQIHFSVLKGIVKIGDNKKEEILVKTDEKGYAFIDVFLEKKGACIIAAELEENRDVGVYFQGRTDGTAHSIFLYSSPVFYSDIGIISCRISVLDFHGIPVNDANLSFDGSMHPDIGIIGKVEFVDNGEYIGFLETNKSGLWNITAQDCDTNVKGDAYIHVIPSLPESISIIDGIDPTKKHPFNEASLMTIITDKFGNRLDPHRLICQVNDETIKPKSYFQDEVVFPIKHTGYGKVDVKIYDPFSPISLEKSILFPAAWLSDPGLILEGTKYTNILYGNPELHRPITKANVMISYDPKLVKFVCLEKLNEPIIDIKTSSTVKENKLEINIESEKPVSPKEYPECIPICGITWECLGEGTTCFEVIADR